MSKGGGDVPSPFDKARFGDRASGGTDVIGYSATFSFDQALQDAWDKLPAENYSRVRVVEVGAELGGFTGTRRMFVRLERINPL